MCGLAGYLGRSSGDPPGRQSAILRQMGDSLRHRGPDGGAQWADAEQGIGFAHRRLAVVELSAAGDQPMFSPSGRYVLIFNGEIYNHLEIRDRLRDEGHSIDWKGHCDTETLLAACEAWGIGQTLERTIGMFAFAVWDRRERELTLARDRLGEKPLYYGWQGTGAGAAFLFGSELKALRCHPAFAAEVDRDALALYMRHGYIPAPHSIYRGIGKVPPGTCLVVSRERPEGRLQAYWSAAEAVARGVSDPLDLSPKEAVDGLEKLLLDAVGKQLMSDVPLGAFLSGGIDSSTIVALMQAQSTQPVKTFTIGFDEAGFNEAAHAQAVAGHLGTDHTELYVSPNDALDVIPRLPAIYDEPFADSSQLPTFMVAELARRRVTVALSGDGGDELFGGYEKYARAAGLWSRIGFMPVSVRRAAGAAIRLAPKPVWNRVGRLAGLSVRHSTAGDAVHKGARLLGASSAAELCVRIGDRWNGDGVVLGGSEPETLFSRPDAIAGDGAVHAMMALDLQTYLPDDILVKVDRAAMAVSLETRVPFLDPRVVEYAWRLPLDLKLRGGRTKWVTRELLHRYVPETLVERPKMGFSVPVDSWLRGPLKDWAEDLLAERRLREQGYFRPDRIRSAWKAHLSGQANLQAQLWTVLMFQSWLAAGAAAGDRLGGTAPELANAVAG